MIYSVNILTWNNLHELLVVSRKEDSKQFCLPGGKVDLNDYNNDDPRWHYYKHYNMPPPDLNTLRRAAARELKEETGLFIPSSELHPLYTGCHEYKNNKYECTSFWAPFKMLPEPKPVEPGTWVGWRKPADLVDPNKNPFWDFMERLFESINVR